MATKAKKPGPLYRFFQKHGWCRHKLKSGHRYCLEGACRELNGGGLWNGPYESLWRELGVAVEKEGSHMPHFNDQRGMTKAKIMAFLRKYGL